MNNLSKYFSEFLGTFFLVCTVVGSGFMAQNLYSESLGGMLLANTIATGAILVVLINVFNELSDSHFNPVVSFCFFLKKSISFIEMLFLWISQIIGGLFGTIIANIMFKNKYISVSSVDRLGFNLFLSEVIATFGLILIIFVLSTKKNKFNTGIAVGLYITAAYWFTSSTSLANPAVTIARVFTENFTGISPNSILYFIIAQFLGGISAMVVMRFFNEK